MIEPKLYSFWEEDGLFVAYQDYEKLKAENDRLRKAGDAMADILDKHERIVFGKPCAEAEKWNAAKDGKPNE
jgi:hypothetical protein